MKNTKSGLLLMTITIVIFAIAGSLLIFTQAKTKLPPAVEGHGQIKNGHKEYKIITRPAITKNDELDYNIDQSPNIPAEVDDQEKYRR